MKMIVMNKIKGYLGMPKGISRAPQMVLSVERNKANRPVQRYMMMLSFSRSYRTPINPKAIISLIVKELHR